MNEFFTAANILSIVAIFLSFVAICISLYQTRLSNKHLLFDKRLDIYLFIEELQKNFDHVNLLRNINLDNLEDIKDICLILTECNSMSNLRKILNNHPDFTESIDYIKTSNLFYIQKIKIYTVFKRKYKFQLSKFINDYFKLTNKFITQKYYIESLNHSGFSELKIHNLIEKHNDELGLTKAFAEFTNLFYSNSFRSAMMHLVKAIKF